MMSLSPQRRFAPGPANSLSGPGCVVLYVKRKDRNSCVLKEFEVIYQGRERFMQIKRMLFINLTTH
jgi:hypothetical protein